MKDRKSKSVGWRVIGGALAILLVSVAMLRGGVSTQAAGSPGSNPAARVENPSAAEVSFPIANADRDVLDLQLD